jgi:cytochrome oxidase Cu insertion factor (SCO1/SenC/PrrC family)
MNKTDDNSVSESGPNLGFLAILFFLACTFLVIALVAGFRGFSGNAPETGGVIGKAGSSSTPVEASADNPPGAVIVDVPWKHLHHIDSFTMQNQDGEAFDTAQFSGDKPFLVSFFFASCPSICRDLNKQLFRLNEQLKKEDVAFVSITVDPENDTPDVLKKYADGFEADSPRWNFLTDQMFKIKQVGEQMFRVEVVDMANHTDNIMLVDKWGRYRDRFKWNDPYDMKRLVKVVKEVSKETEPPLNEIVRTRNAMVGREPFDLSTIQWLREFHLTTSDDKPFFSRDLVGEVWIANFFFTSCPTICKEQSKYLQGLQDRIDKNRAGENITKILSITTDPVQDSTEVLRQYARSYNANPDRWMFLTGGEKTIPRVAGEFFGAMGGSDHHSSELFVVDKWGSVRGRFSWQDAAQEVQMVNLIDSLWLEEQPPAKFEYIDGKEEASNDETESDDDE